MSPENFLVKFSEVTKQEATAILSAYRAENKITKKESTFSASKTVNPKWKDLAKKCKQIPLSSIPWIVDFAEGRGIQIDTMEKMGVGYLEAKDTPSYWNRDSLVYVYTYNDEVVGIRYRDEEGNKNGEKNCFFTMWGIDEITDDTFGVIIVEGESDRMRTQQVINSFPFDKHIVVLSTPTGAFREEWRREIESVPRKLAIPQGDLAASKMAEHIRQVMSDSMHILELPWRRKQSGKDICEWSFYNSDEHFRILMEVFLGGGARDFIMGKDFEQVANRPRQYVIDNFLARRQTFIVAGPPKNMKTWFLLNMIRTMLTPGEAFCGIPNLIGAPSGDKLRIMLVEEEGDEEELYQRIEQVLKGTPWREQLVIAHHLGVKLDNPDWVKRLERQIVKHDTDVLLFDPLQRLHSGEENSSTEMGKVFNTTHYLQTRFPKLNLGILHHFNKAGSISDGWNALRGSGRIAGEVDLGIFIEKRAQAEGPGIKVKFDGRTIPPMRSEDGKDIFKFRFDGETGLFAYDARKLSLGKLGQFISQVRERGIWSKKDAAIHFDVSMNTINTWIDKAAQHFQEEGEGEYINSMPPSNGNPAMIVYSSDEMGVIEGSGVESREGGEE